MTMHVNPSGFLCFSQYATDKPAIPPPTTHISISLGTGKTGLSLFLFKKLKSPRTIFTMLFASSIPGIIFPVGIRVSCMSPSNIGDGKLPLFRPFLSACSHRFVVNIVLMSGLGSCLCPKHIVMVHCNLCIALTNLKRVFLTAKFTSQALSLGFSSVLENVCPNKIRQI